MLKREVYNSCCIAAALFTSPGGCVAAMLAGSLTESVSDPSTTESRIRIKSSEERESSAKRNKITVDKLNDLALDPERIPAFASALKLKSKSAKLFDEETSNIKKESKRQAWAPRPKQNLASSSTQFQRHGKIEASDRPGVVLSQRRHEAKTFGRVCEQSVHDVVCIL